MPYYCTVPRCTSMAGKAKNVSFHQFPRDEELARLWNKILKRGKPYTKYSKVCSLHFRPEDYTITSVGKNKGQWRTLRKDAIPSRNLPSESPGPTTQRTRNTGSWVPSLPHNIIDTTVQQQMAQAIYMQTMLAMQAASSNGVQAAPVPNLSSSEPIDSGDTAQNASTSPISEIEQLLKNATNGIVHLQNNHQEPDHLKKENQSYQCEECSKCFKDPDVYVLHRRTHAKVQRERLTGLDAVEKENLNVNNTDRQETLKANPILANLLKTGVSTDIQEQIPNNLNNVFDVNNILSIENQIMTALAANMESYIRNLSSMINQVPKENGDNEVSSNEFDENSNSDENKEQRLEQCDNSEQDCNKSNQGSTNDFEPNCDNEDFNESKDSSSLVIDENV